MSLNLKEIFEKEYVKGYFHRNKKIFIVSILIFLILGSIGTMLNMDTMNIDHKSVAAAMNSNTNNDAFGDFVRLFIHNFIYDVSVIIGGLLLFIPALQLTFINATNMITLFVKGNPLMLLVGVIPHGIFEIPSSIFATAGALMLFLTEINVIKAIISRNKISDAINESETLIKDAILTIIIVFVLLLIAAFIEAFITPMLQTMV